MRSLTLPKFLLLVAAAGVVGCSSTSTPHDPAVVSLGQFGAAAAGDPATPEVFYLGAGDHLGQEIFTVYVASLRSGEVDEFYATGESDFLLDE